MAILSSIGGRGGGGGGTIPADVATKEFVENEIATALAQKTLVQLHKWEEDD